MFQMKNRYTGLTINSLGSGGLNSYIDETNKLFINALIFGRLFHFVPLDSIFVKSLNTGINN